MAKADQETKTQRVERLKREKNPWEGLDEIRRFARDGFDSIPPEWLGTYFRWWGIYTQGDGAGVVGGKGGEGKAVHFFMVRIRIASGLLTSHQLRTIADLTRRFARGIADITVRQNIQLHWVTIESLPEILEALWGCGLNTLAACGDVTRNITGCPVAGVDRDEICDASPLALGATRIFTGNPEFYNLPRKFKISITGCRVWCAYPEINDISLTATRADGPRQPGGGLLAAGRRRAFDRSPLRHPTGCLCALARSRIRAQRYCRTVPRIRSASRASRAGPAEVPLPAPRLDCRGLPERTRAAHRLHLEPAVEEKLPDDIYRDHIGIHPQKQAGYSYVGAAVLRGRITSQQMRAAADLADRFAAGELRTTNMQNLLIVNVPQRTPKPWPANWKPSDFQ